jgi:hypothetical protein
MCQYLDPSVEETKKFCVNLRRQAKDERILMYYNGHGVPKPTASGEIWVFNKSQSSTQGQGPLMYRITDLLADLGGHDGGT